MNFIKKNKFEIIFSSGLLIAFILFYYNFSIIFVSGKSMSPTYEDKDIVIINKDKNINRNQIAVLTPPNDWESTSKQYVKRIVAIEKDVIKVVKNELYVNGFFYADVSGYNCNFVDVEEEIPVGYAFVMGDNYGNSHDSMNRLCEHNSFLVETENIEVYGEKYKKIGGF